MSKVALPNGEDHAEAARKHLGDAGSLLKQNRDDGAAYLSGYVVECALKTLWLVELGATTGGRLWDRRRGHHLSYLASSVASLTAIAGARTARYFGTATRGINTAYIAAWRPELRYHGPHIGSADAQRWYSEAEAIFKETVAAMYLDGV